MEIITEPTYLAICRGCHSQIKVKADELIKMGLGGVNTGFECPVCKTNNVVRFGNGKLGKDIKMV